MADFNMNLLAQMLMGGGASMYQGKGLTGAAAVGMQQMGAQSMRNTLRKLLAGMPEGGKFAMTSGGPVGNSAGTMNLSLPLLDANAVGSDSPAPGPTGEGAGGIKVNDAVNRGPNISDNDLMNIIRMLGGGTGTPNPFASSPLDVSNADLVGLTPENVVQALHGRQAQEELGLRGRSISLAEQQHALDMPYKIAQIQHMAAQDARILSGAEDKTSEIKNYEYAVKNGFKGTFDEFKNVVETTAIKEYEYAKKNGYTGTLQQWKIDIAKAGATNIDLSVGKKQAMNELEGETFFSKPLDEHFNKYIGSEEAKDKIDRLTQAILEKQGKANLKGKESVAPRQEAMRSARAKIHMDWIESGIRDGRGEVIGDPVYNKSSGVMTWTVRWPTGKVMKIQRKVID